MAGLLGTGLLATRRRAGRGLVAASIFFLPHVQTLAGSAFALCIGTAAGIRLVQSSPGGPRPALRQAAVFVALPGLVSLGLLLALTRPWAQSAWGTLGKAEFRSLNDVLLVGYALFFGLASIPFLFWKGHRKQALVVAAALGAIAATIRVLDLHPFSQPRYYLAAVFFGLLWPVYAGLDAWTGREKRVLAWVLLAVVLLPELVVGPGRRAGFGPFHGVRLAISDASRPPSARQALHRAIAHIREHGEPGDPVLFDYVPQFANWYLPGHPVALMPDLFAKTPLNAASAVWSRVPEMPRWHVWYSSDVGGLWICAAHCDYGVTERNDLERTYVLTSKRLGISQRMCIVESFRTERWLNSPFRMMTRAAFEPDGAGSDVLSVGTACTSPPPGSNDPSARSGS